MLICVGFVVLDENTPVDRFQARSHISDKILKTVSVQRQCHIIFFT